MAVPALVYAGLNHGDPLALRGWAIPTATDIAFAVGVLALLGKRVPTGLKVFLLTLAILDDLGAIVIIALFFAGNLSFVSLAVAGGALAILAALNWRGTTAVSPYLLVGIVMWAAVLKSGVHATLAGVALAFFIPLRTARSDEMPPLRLLEQQLHPPVAYAILPLFAFANAGVSLAGLPASAFTDAVPMGIALGLALGKTAGVFGATLLAVVLRMARLPEGSGWLHMLGVAALCGIGFTMSLFIASLAFEEDAALLAVESRLGILAGSLVSGLAGYLILRLALARRGAARPNG